MTLEPCISQCGANKAGTKCLTSKRTHKTKNTWHYIRPQLHDLLVAGATVAEIAVRFGVSERTIYSWKKSLNSELLANENFDDLTLVVDAIEHYRMLKAEAWRQFDLATTVRDQEKILRLLLSIENGHQRFLKFAGAYDRRPLAGRP